MPTSNSFLNLLEDLKEKFPDMKRKEIVTMGSYIWKQLTWEEKYPYAVKAWHSKKKHATSVESTEAIKLNFTNRLMNHVARNAEHGHNSGLAYFLRIMTNKIWNQLMSYSKSSDVEEKQLAEISSASVALKDFIIQMRKLRKRESSKRRSRRSLKDENS